MHTFSRVKVNSPQAVTMVCEKCTPSCKNSTPYFNSVFPMNTEFYNDSYNIKDYSIAESSHGANYTKCFRLSKQGSAQGTVLQKNYTKGIPSTEVPKGVPSMEALRGIQIVEMPWGVPSTKALRRVQSVETPKNKHKTAV
ncbi:Uncharacterized protein TCM_024099 [Theobroma cacao]|uniref:Uncharacterized protein n=1 Tax=Theobroma cacao TaxID=3641 RepID=A0A061EVL9_THECC|nr:Uncharacterized protein TCM_024099 [Theobroma cacao]